MSKYYEANDYGHDSDLHANRLALITCFIFYKKLSPVLPKVNEFKGLFRLGAGAIGNEGQYVPCGMQMGPKAINKKVT